MRHLYRSIVVFLVVAFFAGLALAAPLPSEGVPTGDQALARPAESIDAISGARKAGGLWPAVIVTLLIGARVIVALRPKDKPPVSGWKAKTFALAAAVSAIAAQLLDVAFGPAPLIALVSVAAFSVGVLIDVFNPGQRVAAAAKPPTTV